MYLLLASVESPFLRSPPREKYPELSAILPIRVASAPCSPENFTIAELLEDNKDWPSVPYVWQVVLKRRVSRLKKVVAIIFASPLGKSKEFSDDKEMNDIYVS